MKKRKIAIIGGGNIGGVLALMLAQKELGDVTLLDLPQKEGAVKGKTLDIMALRPHDGQDVSLRGSSDFAAMAGADVVVVTAGMPRKPGMSRDDLLAINLRIIHSVAKEVKAHAPGAFVILTSNPLDAMVYAFHKLTGFPKQRVAGMAGALDSGRFRTFIAMETGYSVQDISGLVMGGHGPTMIPLVRTATLGGIPLTDLLSAERIEAIVQRTRNAGTEVVKLLGDGSAYFSPAASVLQMVEAHLLDKKRIIPCAALCEGEFGIDGYFVGVPSVIGAGGVEKVLEFPLTEDEQAQLDSTFAAVRANVEKTGL